MTATSINFSQSGEILESDSFELRYILSTMENGKKVFHSEGVGIDAGSIYDFGKLICWAIRGNFNWNNLLTNLPAPNSDEKSQLYAILSSPEKYEEINSWLKEEITANGIDYPEYLKIAEIYCRLFPVLGLKELHRNFLSDNYYGYESSWNYKPWMSAYTYKELVEEAFGVYRKDLARSLSEVSSTYLCFMASFKDSFNIEVLIKVIADNWESFKEVQHIEQSLQRNLTDLEQFNRLPQSLRVRLVKDLIENLKDDEDYLAIISLIEDTFLMLDSIGDNNLKKFKSDKNWEQVHNRAIILASDEHLAGFSNLTFPKRVAQLHGKQLSQGTIALLRSPLEYKLAGDILNNCMGKAGYYKKAKEDKSYCFTLIQDSSLYAACEITYENSRWKILQLNGHGNSPLENRKSLEEEILKLLEEDINSETSVRDFVFDFSDPEQTGFTKNENYIEIEQNEIELLNRTMAKHIAFQIAEISEEQYEFRLEDEIEDFSCAVPRPRDCMDNLDAFHRDLVYH